MKLYWMKNDLNKRHFVRNLTSATANWSINNKWQIQGKLAYAPSIPDLSSLTDYPQQQTPYFINNGNPNLKTSDNWLVQITPTYNYKKLSLSWLMQFGYVNNPFMTQYSYLGNKMFIGKSDNYDYQRSIVQGLFLTVSDIGGFGASANLYLFNEHAEGGSWSKSLTSVNGNVSLWWTKDKVTLEYYHKFPGKYLQGYFVDKGENLVAFDATYKPNKHFTLSAGWWYIFDKKGTKYPSWSYSPVYTYSKSRYIKENGNMLMLQVSYSADFGSIFNAGRRTLNNSDSGSSLLKN